MTTLLTVEPSEEEAARAAAARIACVFEEACVARGRADLGLAGGTTPRRAYEMLADAVSDWTGIHLWLCDERAVGPDDPDSNARMLAETLLVGDRVPHEQVHRIRGELGADAAADDYERELAVIAPRRGALPVLDIALLGLGPDGHTASLFPHHPALHAPETRACVAVHDAPKPPPDRITLTLAALRAARSRLILATGSGKAEAVAAMLAGPDPGVPASLLGGPSTELIVDVAAAARVHPADS